jgi:hypothetical protein
MTNQSIIEGGLEENEPDLNARLNVLIDGLSPLVMKTANAYYRTLASRHPTPRARNRQLS